MKIPTLIGSLANLERLNLSSANFKGPIPYHLGNLSHLRSVDLSGNSFSLVANNLHWLHGLISLKVLDLGGVDLSAVGDWFDSINMLPSLLQLKLKGCRMKNFQTSHRYINFTSLEVLDLSKNSFNSPMPLWLSNTSQTLVHLNIRGSQLRGSIPNYFGDMTSLVVLDLSDNQLEGGIPRTLGSNRTKSSELRVLYLSSNQLNGSLSQILLQKPNLVTLDVGSNSLSEIIYETQLNNLSRLRDFRVGNNLLTFRIRSGWVPSFQLQLINLSSCQLGPQFPTWLQSQREFSSLDISRTGISDTVPDWFWNVSHMVKYVDMSFNEIRGSLPDLSMNFNLDTLNLRYNQFEGPLPHFYPGMVLLDLSANSFSGSISSICEMLVPGNTLSYLALDYNFLSGEVPDCWMHSQNLNILSLGMNNLNGTIPNSIGHLTRLKWLQLQFNGFSGELPLSLKNCSDLSLLSVAYNELSGSIPAWIGEEVQHLKVLNLRANIFEGNIPRQLCQLKSLRYLRLAFNNLSGVIPRCINNFLAMSGSSSTSDFYDPLTGYADRKDDPFIFLSMRLDLSFNRLSGDIPKEITRLVGLQLLDLSGNILSGTIPNDIGLMRNLEFVDLSRNELSCTIPSSLFDLRFTFLNLSYNKFSGKIPPIPWITASNESIFKGNDNLCGLPLANACLDNKTYEDSHCGNTEKSLCYSDCENEDDDTIYSWPFYLSVGLGFAAGLWCFVCPLLISNSWRRAYYGFLSNLYDRIYVIIAVYVIRWRS